MDCRFCKIVSGETPAQVVHESSDTLTFLDYRPLFPGHCLLIPKQHYETLSDLPPALIPSFFGVAHLLARAVEAGMEAEGTFVAINNRVSQSVPHLHLHVVPRRRKDGLRGFFWPRQAYNDEELARRVLEALRSAVQQLSKETER